LVLNGSEAWQSAWMAGTKPESLLQALSQSSKHAEQVSEPSALLDIVSKVSF
jgi:hypothetical protein